MPTDIDLDGQAEIVIEDETLQKGFTSIPNFILKHKTLTPGAKLTYVMLLSYAWEKDNCYPGQTTLAADLGGGERSVRRYLTELQQHGLLIVKRRGLGKTNIYYLPKWANGRPAKLADQDRPEPRPAKLASQEGPNRPSRAAKMAAPERSNRPRKNDPDQKDEDQVNEDQRTLARSKSSPRRGGARLGDIANNRQLWASALEQLRGQVSQANFDAWLRDSRLVRHDGATVIIGVANGFTRDWISQHCVGLLAKTLSNLLGQPLTVRCEIIS